LDSEEAAIKELEKQYARALKDINDKVKSFQADIDLLDQALSQDGLDDATKALLQSQKRSKVYQQNYQKALKGQVSGVLDKLHGDNYATIDKYLKSCYEDSYIGALYDIAQQGMPIITPINQASAVQAILTDSKIVEGYYNRLGVNYDKLKKTITQEISRGIASGLLYSDIARNINNVSSSGLYNAKRIARTEGGRIQNTASRHAALDAKAHGADIVKVWDATLDGKTRSSHRQVDGEIRELDEKFSNGLDRPCDPAGRAAEVINCRCVEIHKPRWDADGGFLKRDNFTGEVLSFENPKNYAEFKERYFSEENVAYMKKTAALEEKYDTKDYARLIGKMSDKEYEQFKKLEYSSPMWKPKDKLADAEIGDIIEPKKTVIKQFSNLSDDTSERSKQINVILNDYSSRKSKWSGKTNIVPVEKMLGVSGRKEWSCDITLREDSGAKTAIHEHLHARSVSYYSPLQYLKWKELEEGSVELYSQEICKQAGIAYRQSYKDEVQRLQIINSITKYGDSYSFARELFEVPMTERYSWLRSKADEAIKSGKLSQKSVEALNNSVEYFKKG
jgi:hypothetical protein